MRPEKAVVIISMIDIHQSQVIDQLICNGISGRLVLKNNTNLFTSLPNDASLKISDIDTENWDYSSNILDSITNSTEKVVYLLLSTLDTIEKVVLLSTNNGYFLSLVLNEISPIDINLHELAPKQSYRFLDCVEITEGFAGSLYYVDFEKNYTRKDWLEGLKDKHTLGANRLILFERHHIEILTRLGIKSKYGS
jgi:hypothetical protein